MPNAPCLALSPADDLGRSVFGALDTLTASVDTFASGLRTGHPQPQLRPGHADVGAWSNVDSHPRAAKAPTTESVRAEQAASPAANLKNAVRNRVFDLIKYAIEDQEALPLSSSMIALNQFLNEHNAAMPLLDTDRRGHLVATWCDAKGSMLSLKFLEGQRIEYAWTLESKNKVLFPSIMSFKSWVFFCLFKYPK